MNYKETSRCSWDTNKDTHSKFISDFKTKNKLQAAIIYGILIICAEGIQTLVRNNDLNSSTDLKVVIKLLSFFLLIKICKNYSI